MNYTILYYCTTDSIFFIDNISLQDEMYVRQWAEGFEGGGVEWGGFVLLFYNTFLLVYQPVKSNSSFHY